MLPPKSTSAFVGKISTSVDDSLVQALLEACGPVKSWKRMLVSRCCFCQLTNLFKCVPQSRSLRQDPENQQPKGYGFVEYEEADGVLRAMRLLTNLAVDGSELVIKANTATQVRSHSLPTGSFQASAKVASVAAVPSAIPCCARHPPASALYAEICGGLGGTGGGAGQGGCACACGQEGRGGGP